MKISSAVKIRLSLASVLGLALCISSGSSIAHAQGGQRGGMGGMGMMGNGRGVSGTVTEIATDHYTVKTYQGDIYTVHFSVNTRIMKQSAGMRGPGGGGMGMGAGGNPPQTLKATDIQVGDDIAAMGEVDPTAKSVGATVVMKLDPERAKQMRDMAANYGKTWIMGKVSAIDGVKVTLIGSMDNVAHTFVADENTTFRERRAPVTLADIQIGDMVRVDGTTRDGSFAATTVNVMRMPPAGTPTVPRNAPPQ